MTNISIAEAQSRREMNLLQSWEEQVAARKIRVDARYVRALLPFVSTECTRYYLGGIYIAPHPDGGVVMVATNGHMMGVIWDVNASIAGEPMICRIPKTLQAAICKAGKRDVHFVGAVAYVTEESWFTNHMKSEQAGGAPADPSQISEFHTGVAYAPPIEGTFPDWRRVVPPADQVGPAAAITFNPKYFEPFAEAGRAITGHKNPPGITIYHQTDDGKSPHSPQIIRIALLPEFFGVLMPMRGNETPAAAPWLDKLISPPTPAASAETAPRPAAAPAPAPAA